MHLVIYAIEIHLMKFTKIAISKSELVNDAKNMKISSFESGTYFSDFQRNKNLTNDPVFSSRNHVIRKVPIINFSRNSKSLKEIYFFFDIRKLIYFHVFFSVCLRSLLFSNCQLAMFFL